MKIPGSDVNYIGEPGGNVELAKAVMPPANHNGDFSGGQRNKKEDKCERWKALHEWTKGSFHGSADLGYWRGKWRVGLGI